MKKISSYLLITIVTGAILLAPQTTEAFNPALDAIAAGFTKAFDVIMVVLANQILTMVSALTGLAGNLLNGVVYHTIVKIGDNYKNLEPLKETWGVLRDLANMAFIFVLLYAGIRTILGAGSDNKKIIVNVVVAAVLMNFSLFFTGVVIDMSNILALTFYDAIAPGIASNGFELAQAGLSNAFMVPLKIATIYKLTGAIDSSGLIITAIIGSILLLVVTFVFFAISLLFIIRYVTLLLVMILSPVYFLALALPKGTRIEKYKDQWLEALLGQAFFAPIYFLLTWVAVRMMNGILVALMKAHPNTNPDIDHNSLASLGSSDPSVSAFLLLINFVIIIVLIVTSLVVAKEWADRAGGGMSKLTSWATGAAGAATFGATGFMARQTLGRGAQVMADSQELKDKAASGSLRAKLALAAARKTSGSSFDARATGVGGTLLQGLGGKATGKGGFTKYKEDKAKEQAKFAASLAPTDEQINIAENQLKTHKEDEKIARNTAAQQVDREFDKPDVLKKLQSDIATAERMAQNSSMSEAARQLASERAGKLKAQAAPIEKAYKERRAARIEKIISDSGTAEAAKRTQDELDRMKGVDDERAKEILASRGVPVTKKAIAEVKKQNPGAGARRKSAYAGTVEKSILAKLMGYNTAAAAEIRKGKSKEKKAIEAMEAVLKKDDEGSDDTSGAPATPPATGATT